MPFLDENKKIFGVSARGFDPNGVRYITIMFDDRPKILVSTLSISIRPTLSSKVRLTACLFVML